MRVFVMTFAVLALLIGASLSLGAASLWQSDLDAGWLLAVSRLPRTCAALLAGAGLALAGVVAQMAVQNRLVEPSLTGTPEAAMIGLLIITLIAPGSALIWKMSAAAGTALIGTAGFMLLARQVPRKDPVLLPIVGIVYGGILGALALGGAWIFDLMQYLGTWRLGEFSGVVQGRYELLWAIAALAAVLYVFADRITVLSLGEVQARSLGLNYGQVRLIGLGIVACITALVVVTVGALPFVGLVAPNIISRLYGDDLRQNLPMVALLGGASVLAADIAGRLLRYPYEIPVSTVYAVLGAGVFLWLLHRPVRYSHG
jgi:iron complex transport system permease protein